MLRIIHILDNWNAENLGEITLDNIAVPLLNYLVMAAVYTAVQLFTYAVFGLYHSFRRTRLRVELRRLWKATLQDMLVLQSLLFLSWGIHYSR